MKLESLDGSYCFVMQKKNDNIVLIDNDGLYLDKEKTNHLIELLTNSIISTDWKEIDSYNIKRSEVMKEELNECMRSYEKPNNYKKLPGYIYFITDGKNNVKIGRTKDTTKRFGEYTKLAFEPIVLNVFKSNDMVADEQYYHEMFFDKHIRGEWFALSDSDIEYVKKIKKAGFNNNNL